MIHANKGKALNARKQSVKAQHAFAESAPGKLLAAHPRSDELKRLLGAVIMMIDDEPTAIDVTRIHLEEEGYTRFVSTTDATQALALIAKTQPDLLLLDLSMPGITGFEILERMEEAGILKDVPTIILTASTRPAAKLKALELGATEFLTKPVDPSELLLRVRNTLAAKAYWQGLGKKRPS